MSLLNTCGKRLVSRPVLNRSWVTRQCLTGNKPLSQKRLLATEAKKPPVPSSQHAFTWKSAVVLGLTAVGLVVYFRNEKEKLQLEKEKRERDKIKRLGKPNIGSPFKLYNVNQDRIQSSEELMKDKFTLLYFGFTHCPDICPEELDKMSEVVDLVKKEYGNNIIQPVFITCDPLRDTKDVVKAYVQDFHPDLIGFVGSPEELKRVARSYRVYTYTPPNVTEKDDYLVDHSIFFYLMDPEGKFVDCYARDKTTEEVYTSFKNYYKEYKQ